MTAPMISRSGRPTILWGVRAAVAGLALITAAGCSSLDVQPVNPDEVVVDHQKVDMNKRETVFGTGGILGGDKPASDQGGSIGVNAFLWRASLDTVSVWPIASADPFGGVIITDWYSPPETPGERFKMNVFILGRSLRADGIRVSLFREVQDGSGNWKTAAVQKQSTVKLEDAILTRARQIRTQSAEN